MTFTAWKFITAVTLLTAMATPIQLAAEAQPHQQKQTYYVVQDLGQLGGTVFFASAEGISNRGWAAGAAEATGNQGLHAFLWRHGTMTDLGTLGGLNSIINFPEKVGREFVAGYAETSQADPLAENFCNLGTGLICVPFLWENGHMTALPTLGGNNGYAANINNLGQVVGFAETGNLDPTCTPPLQLNLQGVVWGPKPGQMQVLPPYPGDDASMGFAINDRGDAVGQSGVCAVVNGPNNVPMLRGVIWHNGVPFDIGGLGGSMPFTAPWAINNKGQVIGQSNAQSPLYGPIVHAFLGEKGVMRDLGVLPNFNFISASFGFNDKGQVVGISLDTNFNAHGFIWQDGVMTDLNDLIQPGALAIYNGNDINDEGEIVGTGIDQNGAYHAVLLIPCDEQHPNDQNCAHAAGNRTEATVNGERPEGIVQQDLREQLLKRLNLGRLVSGSARPN